MSLLTTAAIARCLDAAVLRPETTSAEAEATLREVIAAGVAAVCVRPCDLELARRLCAGTSTGVGTVIGFPHGTTLTVAKVAEAAACIAAGAVEIDMVANLAWMRSGRWTEVQEDIAAVASACHLHRAILKVIVESGLLEAGQIARATETVIAAGADFVKTSTGFNGTGATAEAVHIMLDTARGRIRVKPSGGIRDRQTAVGYLAMGAHRLGVNAASVGAILGAGPAAAGRY